MQFAVFPKSGRRVSRLCFGAMGLNCAFGQFDESELVRSVHRALERGVNVIDTARTYGASERISGRALREWSGERPFLCSKVAPRASSTNPGWGIPNPIEVAYPRGAVLESAHASLKALDTEQLDLLQLHQFWGQYEGAGHWLDELLELKRQGKVAHIGISCIDHRSDMALSMVRSGAVDAVQTILNIFDPLALDTLIPTCMEKGVAVIARCVLDEGGLTGFLTSDSKFDESDFRHDYFEQGPLPEYLRRVDALRKYVPEHARSLAALALKFALHHPGVTTATVSMHVRAHADEDIDATEEPPLPEAVFDELRRRHRWLVNLYQNKYFPPEGEVMASGFKQPKPSAARASNPTASERQNVPR
jgi:aryl-alcohol dehydrogenase-like predicted oxidoreductase